MLLSVPAYYYADYVPLPWHYFLVYQAINAALLLYNLFVLRLTPWVHNIGCKMSTTWVLGAMLTHKQSSSLSSSSSQ